jgi:hypothetical protein
MRTNLAVREEIGRWVDPGVLVVPSPQARAQQPERRLMLAVLESAIADWLVRRDTQAAPRHEARITVEEDLAGWFASGDRRWPYSFENICAALGLDAGGIRRRLGVA